MKKENFLSYKACVILPSCSTYIFDCHSKLEKFDDLIQNMSNLLYLIINNVTCNNKKVAVLNTELLKMTNKIQRVEFNESLYKSVGAFLLESRNLHVIDENGLNWN